MHWVLEHNLNDKGYLELIDTLKRHSMPFTLVKVILNKNILVSPSFDTFSKEATEADNIFIDDNQSIFPFGTMGLSSVSVARKWNPGSLFNEQFTFEKWSKGFGLENLLNSQSQIIKFSDDIVFNEEVFFVRPCEDNKAFAGQVVTKEIFKEWQSKIIEIDDPRGKLNKDTMITIAPYQKIKTEARMFVFNGSVVTGSYYKIGDQVQYIEVKKGDPITLYTKKMVQNYQPAKAFVIDIALTESGYKIIEINNINSVGLYAANVNKFIEAVIDTFS